MAQPEYKSQLEEFPQRLVDDGVVSEEVVVTAIRAARQTGESMVAYLVHNAIADADAIARSAAAEYLLPLVDPKAVEVVVEAVEAVDPALVDKLRVQPLLLRGKRLYLAIADPTYLQFLDDISFQTGLQAHAVIVSQVDLDDMDEKKSYSSKATDQFWIDLGGASRQEVIPILHRLGSLAGRVTGQKVGILSLE